MNNEPESGGLHFEPVISSIRAQRDMLLAIPGVFGVTPGLRTGAEGISAEPAIIVVTRPDASPEGIPTELNDIPVETRTATALDLVEGLLPLEVWEGILPEAKPHIGYKEPDPEEVALTEMTVRNITCHIGPDSGWETLQSFLDATTKSLTVAMFEFYAEHIVKTVTSLGERTQAKCNMILQLDTKDKDIRDKLLDSWGARLDFVPASVSGPDRIFNNSYHTKVAVRDSSAMWLSSGNWSPNSQPEIGVGMEKVLYKQGNREWHLIIEDAALAQMYEKFIKYDMRKAREVGAPEGAVEMPDLLVPEALTKAPTVVVQPHPFAAKKFATAGESIRVKPLMSPDNYAAEILTLIQDAENTLYLQFSYIRQPSAEIFDRLIIAIAEKMRKGLDVRILVDSRSQKRDHSDLLIGQRGWKPSMFRRQTSKIHNKGILIDGKIAVVGSNNWSSDGTQYNRDTSLVMFSREITSYFTEVFLFDWNHLSKPIAGVPEVEPQLAPKSGVTPLGMVRVPWQAWFDD